jgi:hypothetical protein
MRNRTYLPGAIFSGTIFILLALGSNACLAQVNRARSLNRSQQFRLGERIIRVAEPGQLADSVNVWGDVNSPGRYLIPLGTTLPQLISYAFGPQTRTTLTTELNSTKRRIEVDVSHYNPTNGKEHVTHFEYRFNKPLPRGMRTFQLQNNQVVSIRVKRNTSFRDIVRIVAPVISAVATSLLLVIRLGKLGD